MAYNVLSPEETLGLDLKLNDIHIAWLAGLLEGEGTFGNDKRTTSNQFPVPPTPYLKLRMSDKDVVDKFANMVKKNVTTVKPTQDGLGKKLIYSCYVGDRGTVNYILNKILPYMGERRRKEIEKQLEYIQDWVNWYDQGGRDKRKFNFLKQIDEKINANIILMEKTGRKQPND